MNRLRPFIKSAFGTAEIDNLLNSISGRHPDNKSCRKLFSKTI